MRSILFACGLTLICTAAGAQNEDALRRAFEGTLVTVKLDLPATESGVDLHPEQERPLDFARYADRLKDHGTALTRGAVVMVTKVKVKDDLIEFQLAGGGYGTFGDETSASVHVPSAEKTQREKNLEAALRSERDEAKRKTLREELDDLRKERERVDALARATVAAAEASRAEQIRQRALASGSRFNLRYRDRVPAAALTPEGVRAALAAYVDFEVAPIGGPARPAGLRKGLTLTEVAALYGQPESTSSRQEGSLTVLTAVYATEENRVTAEFVEGVLIRYSIASR